MIRRPDRIGRSGQPIRRYVADAIDAPLHVTVVARKPARPDVVDPLIEVRDLIRQIGNVAAGQPRVTHTRLHRGPRISTTPSATCPRLTEKSWPPASLSMTRSASISSAS